MENKGYKNKCLKIIQRYEENYLFLGFREENWQKLYAQVIAFVEKQRVYDFKKVNEYVLQVINRYIKRQIAQKKVRIINNLFILVSKNTSSDYSILLQEFLNQLDQFSIEMDEEYYEIFKQQSTGFKKILEHFRVQHLNFSELKNWWQEYYFYQKFKVYGKSLEEIKQLFWAYFSVFDESLKNQIQRNINRYIDKFRYLFSYEEYFQNIYQIYLVKMQNISIDIFRKALFYWSLERLELLINEYKHNQCVNDESKQKKDYLLLLLQDALGFKKMSEKQEVSLKAEFLDVKKRRESRTLYSYFEKIKPELSAEDEKVIDTLYSRLSKERQDGIQGYIEGKYHQKDKIGRKASSDIGGLQKQFSRYLKTGTLNLRYKKKTLYSYFEKIKPELSEEDKKVIDTLYSHLSKERQDGIQGYLERKYYQIGKIRKKAANDINLLQQQFRRYLEKGYLNLIYKKKTLYSYFEKIKLELSEEDKKAIDTLYSRLSKERQEGIQGYIERKYHFSDVIGKKAANDINLLQQQFRRYLEKGYLNLIYKKKTLYSYFEEIKLGLSEEDKKAIDTLYSCLSEERQEGIQGYIEGKYHATDRIGRKASHDIQQLQRKFEKYLESGVLDVRMSRTLYSYFEKIKSELSEENKKVIDTLYSRLSKERQKGIEGYIEGKYHQTDAIGRKASHDIQQLQRKFEKYLESGVLDVRMSRTLYSYFEKIKLELSEEDKKAIDTLYSRLSKERQKGIEGYIEGKYHRTNEIGRKAPADILKLQRRFIRYLEIESLEGCSKVQLKKKQVLLEALKVIETSFYRLGYTSSDYQKYKDEKMLDIVSRGNASQLTILYIFVMESFYFIKEQEKIRTL